MEVSYFILNIKNLISLIFITKDKIFANFEQPLKKRLLCTTTIRIMTFGFMTISSVAGTTLKLVNFNLILELIAKPTFELTRKSVRYS